MQKQFLSILHYSIISTFAVVAHSSSSSSGSASFFTSLAPLAPVSPPAPASPLAPVSPPLLVLADAVHVVDQSTSAAAASTAAAAGPSSTSAVPETTDESAPIYPVGLFSETLMKCAYTMWFAYCAVRDRNGDFGAFPAALVLESRGTLRKGDMVHALEAIYGCRLGVPSMMVRLGAMDNSKPCDDRDLLADPEQKLHCSLLEIARELDKIHAYTWPSFDYIYNMIFEYHRSIGVDHSRDYSIEGIARLPLAAEPVLPETPASAASASVRAELRTEDDEQTLLQNKCSRAFCAAYCWFVDGNLASLDSLLAHLASEANMPATNNSPLLDMDARYVHMVERYIVGHILVDSDKYKQPNLTDKTRVRVSLQDFGRAVVDEFGSSVRKDHVMQACGNMEQVVKNYKVIKQEASV